MKWFNNKISGIIISLFCLSGILLTSCSKNIYTERSNHEIVTGWVRYASPEAGFTADYPTQPVRVQKNLEISSVKRTVSYSEFSSIPTPDLQYTVGYIELPKKYGVFGSSLLLKGALKAIAESDFDAEIIDKTLVKHGQYPAIEFHMKQGDQEIRGRLILDGTTMYKVAVTYPKSSENPHTQEFIDSFDIT